MTWEDFTSITGKNKQQCTQEAVNFEILKAALASLGFSFTDGNLNTTAVLNGDVTIDLGATNTLLTTIEGYADTLQSIVDTGKGLVTETSSADIKTAVQALAAIISGGKLVTSDTATTALAALISSGKLLVTETSAESIKTAAEALAAIISGGKLLTTETNSGNIKTAAEALAAIISGGKLLTTETSGASILSALTTLNSAAYAKKKVAAGIVSGAGNSTETITGTNLSFTNTSSVESITVTVGSMEFTLKPGYGIDDIDLPQFTEIGILTSGGSGTWLYIVKA